MAGKLSRFLKISAMTTGVTGRHFTTKLANVLAAEEKRTQNIDNSYRKSGEAIARTLATLKGPVMKFGQMASIQSGFLPAALTAPLSTLRQDAEPEPFPVIQQQIESELHAPLDALFAAFEETPVATASVGQVHRATTHDGRDVAVKVQFPKMDQYVEADVSSLTMVLKAVGVAGGQNEALKKVAAEFRSNLVKELNFRLEAQNQTQLRAFHQKHHPFVSIPEVLPELSATRVLTSVFLVGDSLDQASTYPAPVRDKIGARLLQILYDQIFRAGLLHGDPNPSNYAFTADGGIILYDFGCIKPFERAEIDAIALLLRGFLDSDPLTISSGLKQIGALAPEGPELDIEFFQLLDEMLKIPLHPEAPFDVARSDMHLRVLSDMAKFRKYRKQLVIPHRLLLLQRVNVGCYGNLRKLGASIYVRKIIEDALRSGE
ncbi:MAG: AarF/ABC1/UbiB kinase family protein [Deltaproteobacteria bacterium]|nr:AarF/ABC1/UbiB kinase family protein [Deltaproteobacteria bacterium]MBN2674831.1 AarF/ABC1/UbiB kinase family protein [Deltaproteobacteria bacterium]